MEGPETPIESIEAYTVPEYPEKIVEGDFSHGRPE